ncbi:sphingosine 1-phosphate receptor 2-like [Clavelina lepadiformis]|uniref:sphingosine 1-phosphate receptor 2-like n=1 Tax=Clavelina lepadiformis TaxID=159417 RepID=UPI0040412FF3
MNISGLLPDYKSARFEDDVNLTTFLPQTYNDLTSFNTMNSTISEHDYNLTHIKTCEPLNSTPLVITAGLMSCGIIVGNVLVIYAIIGGYSHTFRPMFWFITHLCITDLSLGLMLLWNYCLAAIFEISNSLTSLSILNGVWVTSACSSVLGIFLLAFDRYMQVVHRRMHNLYFNQCNVGLAIFFALLIPMLMFNVAPIVFNWSCKERCNCREGEYIECLPISSCSQIIPPFTKSYILVVVLYLSFILPLPVIIYCLIFIKARKSTQAIRQKMRHRDRRLIRTLIVIMVVFIVTLSPSGIVMIVDYFSSTYSSKLTDYAIFTFLLGTCNSLANPILYIWRIPAIKRSLQQKLCCRTRRSTRTDSRTSRTAKKSAENLHSDPACLDTVDLNSALNHKKKNTFNFCTERFPSNISEASHNSTPLSKRSATKIAMRQLKLPSGKKPRNHAKTNSDLLHVKNLLPLTNNNVTEEPSCSSNLFVKKETEALCEDNRNNCSIILHSRHSVDDDLSDV